LRYASVLYCVMRYEWKVLRLMIKKIVVLIAVISIFYCIADNRYVSIKVLDRATQDYIYEPRITMFPDISLEGQPGTGAVGPYIYKPLVPIPVLINVSAEGYKSEKKVVLFVKGQEIIIYLTAY